MAVTAIHQRRVKAVARVGAMVRGRRGRSGVEERRAQCRVERETGPLCLTLRVKTSDLTRQKTRGGFVVSLSQSHRRTSALLFIISR